MDDQYLFAPISKGLCTYREMFIDCLYSIQDIDLMWQMINQKLVSDLWDAVEAEKKR